MSEQNDSARTILQRYGDAWQGKRKLPLERDLLLAFWVTGESGGEYHLVLTNEPGAAVRDGAPDEYDLGFQLNIDLLRRLDRGEMSALTAMGQARRSDPIPLTPTFGARLATLPDVELLFRKLAFHFWTRGWPEVIPFGEQATRLVHGGNLAVLVYDKDFRSAWFQVKPGMHINAEPRDQVNDFPQLITVTRGRFMGRFDGQERTLAEGEALLIPAGMSHEFWAEDGEYGEGVWIAFGEGA
jgi:mannose-6-phosphate isomerase-like protein (cupin superfamily)